MDRGNEQTRNPEPMDRVNGQTDITNVSNTFSSKSITNPNSIKFKCCNRNDKAYYIYHISYIIYHISMINHFMIRSSVCVSVHLSVCLSV